MEKNAVPGAQFAMLHGTEEISAATGIIRCGAPEPIDTHTAFAFGSVTKAFTATLISQLISDGDVDLDMPIASILHEFRRPRNDPPAAITPRHLLTHTSGLISEHHIDDPAERSLFRYSASLAATPALHRPGAQFSYSNAGYIVLGRLVEEVTAAAWQDTLEHFLLNPLGITPWFINGSNGSGRSVAHGHAVRPGHHTAHPVEVPLPPTWAPAGGLAGSAEELIAFCRLHLGTHPQAVALLDEQHRAGMHTRDPAADAFGMAEGWALGLAHYGDGWLGHDGTVDGTVCHLRFHPGIGVAVALTANATSGTALWFDVVAELRALGLDIGDYQPPVPAPQAPGGAGPGIASLVGDYANGDTIFSIRPHEGGVHLSDDTGLVADVSVHDGLLFTARRIDTAAAPYTGRFVPDPDTGEIVLMQLAGRSAKRCAHHGLS